MKLNEAIEVVAEYYIERKEIPSHCDVRCTINDLLDSSYYRKGYNQDLAHKEVVKIVNNALGAE